MRFKLFLLIYSSRWTRITHSLCARVTRYSITRHRVWLGPHSRNLSSKAPTHALQPAVCSHGSRLQRSPRMDVSPPAAQASAFLFLHPSCPSVPWLLSPRYTPHHLQRDRACCTHSSRSPHQDTEASASPAPIATVKASPQATTVTFMARSPTTRWGTRLLRQELVPSCPCWLLPKV